MKYITLIIGLLVMGCGKQEKAVTDGRMGWLELTPGIGKTKMPSQFIDMVLLK